MGDSADTALIAASSVHEESAYSHFLYFHLRYGEELQQIERHLEGVTNDLEKRHSTIYRHWHEALKHLRQGVYLISKRIPLPDPEKFLESIKTFSITSAIRFLRDLASACGLNLESLWVKQFHEHINILLQTHLQMMQQQERAR